MLFKKKNAIQYLYYYIFKFFIKIVFVCPKHIKYKIYVVFTMILKYLIKQNTNLKTSDFLSSYTNTF